MMCLSSVFLYAQHTDNGIHFEQGLTWDQVKAKARAENKYIFVDCYATWCGPCKIMDKNVYPNDLVGAYVNSKFISIKVQMDTSGNDDKDIALLYPAAREMEKEYKINSLPSFLFFSPDGNIVQKETGGQAIKEFMVLMRNAIDPNKQLYTLANNAFAGKLSYAVMPALIKRLKDYKEDSLANEVAKVYVHGYLEKLSDDIFYTKETLKLFRAYSRVISSSDRIFRLYYQQPGRVDSIMGEKGYAKDRVNFIITNQEIQPVITRADKEGVVPDWKKIQKDIQRKYNKEYAVYNVLNAEINWYSYKLEWEEYLKLLMQKWKIYGEEEFKKSGALGLNDMAWTVFIHSNNKKQLRTALVWSEMSIPMDKNDPTAEMDTKANILYKLENKDKALSTEIQVVEMCVNKVKNTTSETDKKLMQRTVEMYQRIVDKMRIGKPIIYAGMK